MSRSCAGAADGMGNAMNYKAYTQKHAGCYCSGFESVKSTGSAKERSLKWIQRRYTCVAKLWRSVI
jgi:hypothetical protein